MLLIYLVYGLTLFWIVSFAQGLRKRHIDLIEEGAARSSTSITRVYNTLRQCCVTAIKRLQRRKKMRIGGRHAFVVIDESKFRHKRKVQHWMADAVEITIKIKNISDIQVKIITWLYHFDFTMCSTTVDASEEHGEGNIHGSLECWRCKQHLENRYWSWSKLAKEIICYPSYESM